MVLAVFGMRMSLTTAAACVLGASSLPATSEPAAEAIVPVIALGRPTTRIHRAGVVAVSIVANVPGTVSVTARTRRNGTAIVFAPEQSTPVAAAPRTLRFVLRPLRAARAAVQTSATLHVRVDIAMTSSEGVKSATTAVVTLRAHK